MSEGYLPALLIVGLPAAVFTAGVGVFGALGDAPTFERQAARLRDRPDRRAPYKRLGGYTEESLRRYFSAFDTAGFQAFRRTLQLDLLFPPLYGAAIATALFIGRSRLDPTFAGVWILALTLLLMAADWTENIALLSQLPRYQSGAAPNRRAVILASAATQAKLCLLLISVVAVVVVAIAVGRRG